MLGRAVIVILMILVIAWLVGGMLRAGRRRP
jgi:hypothetical protein